MRKNGFSLLELMIALGVLTIIATVAVPKVQVWNARNRGLQTVVEILSDFSKARSIAGYTVVGDKNNGKIEIPLKNDGVSSEKMPIYIGIRLQTAIVFRAHEYAIYQKETMKASDWANSTVLKKNRLPESVSIVKVNNFNISPTAASNDITKRLVFTSNGLVKEQGSTDTSEDESFAEASKITCGGQNSPMGTLVFSAIVRSRISLNSNSYDSVWYKVDVDQTGEYHICMAFSAAEDYLNSIFTSNGNTLSI